MKSTWKLILGFILVGALSAGVGAATFSYLSNRQEARVFNGQSVGQPGFRMVNYATPAENTDFTFAAEQTVHAVVHIKSVSKAKGQDYIDPWDYFFGITPGYRNQPRVGFGSGVIISNDGYIVTNNHVIDGADEIEVTMNDDKSFKAKLIGADPESDLALLKIEGTDFPFVPFGDSDQLKVGEWVLAVGNPFNLTSTVTAGIVSAKGRGNVFSGSGYGMRDGNAQQRIESYIQTDAAVNPGNSGGALVNTKGELVGINTLIYSQTGNYVGYSFAIPMSIVKKVVSDIKQYGVIQKALLGVTIRELPELKQNAPDIYNKLKVNDGVYVEGFSSSSSAKAAGIQAGDIIVAIDGVKIKNFSELKAQIGRYNPGNVVKVRVQRGAVEKEYDVELRNDQGTTNVVKNVKPFELLGASFKEISDSRKEELGIGYGIEVTNLKDGKLKDYRILEGSVILTANNVIISSVEEFEMVVQSVMKQDPDNRGLFLRVVAPNGKVGYYAIDLNG